MMAMLSIILTAIFALIGWVGNRLINTLDRMDSNIKSIDKTLTEVVTRHDDLKERVDTLERLYYEKN